MSGRDLLLCRFFFAICMLKYVHGNPQKLRYETSLKRHEKSERNIKHHCAERNIDAGFLMACLAPHFLQKKIVSIPHSLIFHLEC